MTEKTHRILILMEMIMRVYLPFFETSGDTKK